MWFSNTHFENRISSSTFAYDFIELARFDITLTFPLTYPHSGTIRSIEGEDLDGTLFVKTISIPSIGQISGISKSS